MRTILFNEINFDKCELYYCIYCAEFGKKSKLKLDENDFSSNSEPTSVSTSALAEPPATTRNLTCTKCSNYLVKDNQVQNRPFSSTPTDQSLTEPPPQPQTAQQQHQLLQLPTKERRGFKQQLTAADSKRSSIASIGSNLTLKDVLNSLRAQANKDAEDEVDVSQESRSRVTSVSTNGLGENKTSFHASQIEEAAAASEAIDLAEKFKSLMNSTQINKAELDEMNADGRRINNNLKLYLIINVLNQQEGGPLVQAAVASGEENEEESLVSIFNLKKFSHCVSVSEKTDSPTSGRRKLHTYTTVPRIDTGYMCVLTSKRVIVFKILNEETLAAHVDFDKCMRREHVFSVNQIEFIEVALGQHFFQLEVVVPQSGERESGGLNDTIENEQQQAATSANRQYFKLVTLDVYQTQAIISNLLS
jgi:hypothetical protein